MSEMVSPPDVTAELLAKLKTSPTDLRKLVTAVLRRGCPAVAIPASAIRRWQRDDPESWRSVRDWLLSRGTVPIVVGGQSSQ